MPTITEKQDEKPDPTPEHEPEPDRGRTKPEAETDLVYSDRYTGTVENRKSFPFPVILEVAFEARRSVTIIIYKIVIYHY